MTGSNVDPSRKERPAPDLVWDEYKYRHDLCWRLILQTTVGAILIYVVPYVENDIATELQCSMVALPAIGIGLVWFGLTRLQKEQELLSQVREHHWYPIEEEGSFQRDARRYLGALILLGIADIVVICTIWVPHLT
jgi:hypothetical protein